MMIYGIELEMFYIKDTSIAVPPKVLPLDGCGAIVELRSIPHADIYSAAFDIKAQLCKFQDQGVLLSPTSIGGSNRHRFTVEEFRLAARQSNKDTSVDVCNIYGKERRLLPRGVVSVSVQLNFSNRTVSSYIADNVRIPDQYGLLDTLRIVKALDKEFEKEIKESGRVMGEYAIKDNVRLEYRSLPASVFFLPDFEKRISKLDLR